MSNIRQIITDWETPAGSGEVTVMYFIAEADVADQRAALASFWGDLDGTLTVDTNWRIRDAGVDVDETTGTLVDAWSDFNVYQGAGAAPSAPVPDASQLLLRWRTTTIINGRFLQGRTYVPGLAAANTIGGNVSPAVLSGGAVFITDFLDALVGFSVWHRPSDEGPGQAVSVTSGGIWSELAVLRRRRK